jgi:hypothetical protein
MRAIKRIRAGGVLGLSLLSLPLLRLTSSPPTSSEPAAPPPPARRHRLCSSLSRSPFERGLWEARSWRFRAQLTVNQKRYELEAWDPVAIEGMDQDQCRRQLMAADPDGYLRRARAQARLTAALARTPDEVYQATELLASIDCDGGFHEAELQHAWKLMALDPYEPLSLLVLRKATACNRQEALERWAEAALDELPTRPPVGGAGP